MRQALSRFLLKVALFQGLGVSVRGSSVYVQLLYHVLWKLLWQLHMAY